MSKKTLSKYRIVSWLGDESTDAPALLQRLVELIQGDNTIDKMKKDILSYEPDEEERELCEGTCEKCGDPKIVYTDDTEEECKCLECGHVFESSLR